MTHLPIPQENETIHTYLARLGYHWADLWQIEDVLICHEDYDEDKTLEENYRITGITEDEAIDILCIASSQIDHSGGGWHGFELLGHVLRAYD